MGLEGLKDVSILWVLWSLQELRQGSGSAFSTASYDMVSLPSILTVFDTDMQICNAQTGYGP